MDLPAASIFLVLLFAIGPMLGWMALGGVLIQGLLAAVTAAAHGALADGGHPAPRPRPRTTPRGRCAMRR